MTRSEYQELIECIGPQFDPIHKTIEMPPTYDELEASAREFPGEDRARLARMLISGLIAPGTHGEIREEVERIADGRSGATSCDRERLEEAIAKPFRVRDRRIDAVGSRLDDIDVRLEELEPLVSGDGVSRPEPNPRHLT